MACVVTADSCQKSCPAAPIQYEHMFWSIEKRTPSKSRIGALVAQKARSAAQLTLAFLTLEEDGLGAESFEGESPLQYVQPAPSCSARSYRSAPLTYNRWETRRHGAVAERDSLCLSSSCPTSGEVIPARRTRSEACH
jgi:hypothetical protein